MRGTRETKGWFMDTCSTSNISMKISIFSSSQKSDKYRLSESCKVWWFGRLSYSDSRTNTCLTTNESTSNCFLFHITKSQQTSASTKRLAHPRSRFSAFMRVAFRFVAGWRVAFNKRTRSAYLLLNFYISSCPWIFMECRSVSSISETSLLLLLCERARDDERVKKYFRKMNWGVIAQAFRFLKPLFRRAMKNCCCWRTPFDLWTLNWFCYFKSIWKVVLD